MQLAGPQVQIIVDFLKSIGLPHENILAVQDRSTSNHLPERPRLD